MQVNKRVSVLFENADDISARFERTDTHVTVEAPNDAVVQTRWQFVGTEIDVPENVTERVTWAHNDRKFNVLHPYINAGFNFYTTNVSRGFGRGKPLSSTPKYSLLHLDDSEIVDVQSYLPSQIDYNSFLHWRLDDCQYDIAVRGGLVEVNEFCPLLKNSAATFRKETGVENMELGLFYVDSQDSVDINLSGIRCGWTSDAKVERCLKTTLFYNPAYIYNSTNGTSPISLQEPVGLHPKVQIDLTSYEPVDKCEYYVFLQLPVEIFVDKFQSDPMFVFGEHDLELPAYKLEDKSWGSETLYSLKPGELNEITLHSRYVAPASIASYANASFTPEVFRACDTDSDTVVQNPFYTKGLGLESFFTPNTNFAFQNSTTLTVNIPRPGLESYQTVQYSSMAIIVFGLIYLLSKMFFSKPQQTTASKSKKIN
ncbi:Pbn1p KNAG_0C00310 [Huiozyma naganishii CBS 8797]|uniref:Protein PBN1 n=1 Tax=Huiozyma naganishii (strain ATCC MYA-139 / BCRC 22969 / CBS 8797 / KCTC 17520 / NBRC 10181 / NCYC 3082 / Yp74L-3) TaxID=1071383 RepID=J7S482_HUIN7|nr:hypothetical protein KNAG_0C00310 [Kazachstania naganishii CBS 8797]CCK69144.1 hypothetical protein KNAG_0C00310 [Kazachstania naganishii CBS 8797]